ncbi:LPS export ABC transporter permease LptG [bacterium]|nr:LPS export ABC transporter permease LptG [bacterium]
MRILTRYIMSRALRPLILFFLGFMGIFVLVDLFDHAHTFIDNQVSPGVVLAYYAYFIPLIFVLTVPVAMLLATLLSVGSMSRQNELMAMKGAGLSLYRILTPVLVLAAFVSLLNLCVGEFVVPPATRQRIAIEDQHLKHQRSDPRIRKDIIYVRPDGAMFLIGRYNTRRQIMEEITIEEFDERLRLRTRIDAATARWADDHWILESGRLRRFTAEGETASPFETMELKAGDPSPKDLVRRKLEPEERGYLDLRRYIVKLRAGGTDPRALEVQLHLKIAFPFVTLIMTLLGAPLAAGTRRSGFAIAFASALAISFFYYGAIQVAQVLGRQGVLSPPLAAWIANGVFALVGVWILARTPK